MFNPFNALKQYRRSRVLQGHRIDDALWQATLVPLPLLRTLTTMEQQRLRDWTTLFLYRKQINGAGGLLLTDAMRLTIAAQACLLILNLDIDFYDGWEEVIVYPDEFVPEIEEMDEYGVMHHRRDIRSGEAWLGGPVVLAWADIAMTTPGYNVVLHEFAHKLDMRNGHADGFPPLHPDMQRPDWSAAFTTAYLNFCRRVDGGEHTIIDPYAATAPAEFFAVLTEAFFETPQVLRHEYPEVYAQLCLFYRQDPGLRMPA